MTNRDQDLGKEETQMKYLPYLTFALFLAVYSTLKYQAVPSQMGQSAYIKTTIILVILTAIIPYLIGLFMAAKVKLGHPFAMAIVVPFALSVIGLAAYFFMYIQPFAPGMSVTQVLPRAIIPGLCLSGLVLFWKIWREKQASRT